jgi:iron complex outermembrane receptor protein
MMRTTVALAVGFLSLVSMSTASESAAAVTRYDLNIPRQTLDTALKDLAAQTGLQIACFTDTVDGSALVGPLSGAHSATTALEMLLAPQGLSYKVVNDRTIAVVNPRDPQPLPSAPAAGLRSLSGEMDAMFDAFTVRDGSRDGELRLAITQADQPAPSSAEAVEGALQLEEVIVTAQKRMQSIKDVPISMTAYSEHDLEKFRVQTFEDVLLMTPGVQYGETSDFLKTVSIRGIHGNIGGLWQTASVTIDDASLIATYNGFLLASRLFDIERVEILRGPQGTLTGSNSTAGTFNIITKKPRLDEFEAEATLDYSRFNTTLMRGMMNLPLSDTFALRTTAYVQNSDGALRNAGGGGGGSTEDHIGGRVAARWQATESLRFDATFNYEHQKFGASNNLPIKADFTDPDVQDEYWAGWYAGNQAALEAVGGSLQGYDYIQDVGLNGGTFFSDVRELTEHKFWYGTLRADYAMANHDVALMYTHYEHQVDTLFDEDKSAFPLITSSWDGGPRSNYAELRITSNYDGRFNWVAGASYMKERRILDLLYHATDAWAPAYFGGDLPDGNFATLPYWLLYWSTTLEQIENVGAFANVFYDITPRLHLAVGGRLSNSKTATQSYFEYTGEVVDGSSFGSFDNPFTADETNFDPRVALNFDLTDDVTTYVQFATGFRSGYGSTAVFAVQNGYGPAEVGGETVKNYEVGMKGRFLNGRGTFGTALFYMDYSDMQLGISVPCRDGDACPDGAEVFFDDNVQSASSTGIEAEGSFLLTDHLKTTLGVSYVESEIDELENEGVIYPDVPFPNVPAWTVDASLQYSRPVREGLTANVVAAYSYRDRATDDFPWDNGGIIGRLPAYDTLDLGVGVEGDRWSAMAYFDNVLDQVYWQDSYLDYGVAGAFAPFNPRTLGVRFTVRM